MRPAGGRDRGRDRPVTGTTSLEVSPAERTRLTRAWLDLEAGYPDPWTDLVPGPPLAEVLSRLTATPRDFLDERVDLLALAGDVLRDRSPRLDPTVDGLLRRLAGEPTPVRQGAAIMLWLWASESRVEPFATPASSRPAGAGAGRAGPAVGPGRAAPAVADRTDPTGGGGAGGAAVVGSAARR